jgi:hypothetical protein
MKKCGICGAEAPDSFSFCALCGASFPKPEPVAPATETAAASVEPKPVAAPAVEAAAPVIQQQQPVIQQQPVQQPPAIQQQQPVIQQQPVQQPPHFNQQIPQQPFAPKPAPFIAREQPKPKKSRPEFGLLYACYAAILFFMGIPSMSHYIYKATGYGNNGYGLTQQIASFWNLIYEADTTALKFVIGIGIVLLITAVVVAATFTVISMILLGKSVKSGINKRLLLIVNSLILGSFILIFALTIAYLTFSFMCILLLTAIAFMTLLKPEFAADLFKRREHPGAGNSGLLTCFVGFIIAMMLSPICAVQSSVNVRVKIALNFYSLIGNANELSAVSSFDLVTLYILPFIALLTAVILFIYLLAYNISGKKFKLRYLSVNTMLAITLALSFTIGASNLTKIIEGADVVNYFCYYILLLLNITAFILRPVFSAVENKRLRAQCAAEKEA